MKKKPAKKAPAKKKKLPGYDPIPMHDVDSSTIYSIGWKAEVLRVVFRTKDGGAGDAYRYRFVPESVFNSLLNADTANYELGMEGKDPNRMSVGSLFYYMVRSQKDRFPYEKEEK